MFSVVGDTYSIQDFYLIDLSLNNGALKELDNKTQLTAYINTMTDHGGKPIAYGGYGEERDFYLKSPLFSGERRTIHLGIDVWLPIGHPVYAATSGQIYGKAYNSQFLDYGYTVILKHMVNDEALFALYGHLSAKDFDSLIVGDTVDSGDIIAYVGDESQNGGWAPHLHFQLIRNIGGYQSDYPGVCHMSQKEKCLENCPDPTRWIL